ncbi:MAG: UbiA family prenyltransferase [Candidatus Aenigmarchaeota archaeon]|nr:UbiA family prenyltransferase [Candidatus Aenigmarchaeota archaeon]
MIIMKEYFDILRINVCLLTVFGIIAGLLIIKSPFDFLVILALVAGFLFTGAGNVINDYFDFETDRINKPERPIPSGKISKKKSLVYYILLSITGLGISFLVSLNFFIIALLSLVVFTLYPGLLKKIPFVKNVTVAFLSVIPFIASTLIHNSFSLLLTGPISIFIFIAFFGTLAREILKDIEDIKGDQVSGIKTLPIIIGRRRSKIIADVILLIAVLSLFYPLFTKIVSYWYLIGIIPATVFSIYSLVCKEVKRSQKWIKISMFFVLLGFILGSWF